MNAVIRLQSRSAGPSAPQTRAFGAWTSTFYWSVRRELWEHRSIYLAPIVVAGVGLLIAGMQTLRDPQLWLSLGELMQGEQEVGRVRYIVAAGDTTTSLIALVGFFVGALYSLDALYGERRSRAILFWKSLPVSDRAAVLSKAGTALVVLPLVVCAIIVATRTALLVLGSAMLMLNGFGAAPLWADGVAPIASSHMIYGALLLGLWCAPLCGWLLLVSAWAPSKPLLWAVIPPCLLVFAERVTLGSSHISELLLRENSSPVVSILLHEVHFQDWSLPILQFSVAASEPPRFLGEVEMWGGLAVAALFLFGAAWLRRRAEPI